MQNCIFLINLLRASKNVGKVFAINGGYDVEPQASLMLEGLGIEFVRLNDVESELDVLIEAGSQVSAEAIARIRARGGRAVGYRFGNSYVIDMERIIFGKESGSIFNGTMFDEIWTNAQHLHTNKSYWETIYRCPVRCLPHIWEPTFIDKAILEFPEDLSWGYKPGAIAKRISVFEPNINVVKFCGIPLCVIEEAFRRCPDRLDHAYILSGFQLKEHVTFQHFVASLDIQKSKKVSFEGRFNSPYWLSKYTDVVVAHQWECGLNYAYYDALYGGYPLVHNSPLLPAGIGYRYHDFDCQDGGRTLASVLMTHDHVADEYTKRSHAFLDTVRATAPQNIKAHELALQELSR